jgi:DNA-binding transcriptional LysR family regulator
VRLSEIDLNLLVVFDAIHREQNLTRAAEKLHLTQPALSHALSRLRDLFRDQLFTRSGRGMLPTPLARTLIGPVRDALKTLERGLFPGQAFDPANTPRNFVVGLRDVMETIWLPVLVKRMQHEAPLLTLASTRVARQDLETDLMAGTLDLAFDIPLPVSSNVRHLPISEEKLAVLARRGHPGLATGLNLDTYLAQQHVLVSSRRRGPGLEDLVLQQMGRQRKVALRCQSYLAACQVVQSTDLLLTMPERLAKALNLSIQNELLAFPGKSPHLSIHMYWSSAADNDPANVWLREQVAQLAREL